MPAPPPIISSITPLAENAIFTSAVTNIARATKITGSVYADQPGTLVIQQSGDGTNFDLKDTFNVPANAGVSIDIDAVQPYVRAVYTNGTVAQTVFRLFVNLQDAFGAFLSPALAPSSGGAYFILYDGPGGYEVVGRFDGTDPFNALENAAIYHNKNGQYAAFPVVGAIVAVETLTPSTSYVVGSF